MPKSSVRPSKIHSKHSSPVTPRPTIGLGRGLSEIIAQGTQPTHTAPGTNVRQISLSQIVANPRQPRSHFREEPLDELVTSIREHGILQPITVRPHENHFEIIAGERRFRACQKAGLSTIPAIVKTVSDIEAYELALIENLQRENLDPIEEARGYRRLSSDFSMTQEEIAQKVGKKRATVANAMRLLDLPEEIQGYLSQNRISTGHAKAILSLENADQQIRLAHAILKEGLNVRQTELFISRLHSSSHPNPKKSLKPSATQQETLAHLHVIQEALQQKLATRVFIHATGNGGRIEIQYYNPSDLERLLEFFQIQL